MAKGFYTQGVCVLLERAVSLAQLESAVTPFTIYGKHEGAENILFGGPSLVLSFRPEVNGFIAVDIFDRPWPDAMGDPQTDPLLFGAWSTGQFGPFTYPHSQQLRLRRFR
jgi:hypothetical protein